MQASGGLCQILLWSNSVAQEQNPNGKSLSFLGLSGHLQSPSGSPWVLSNWPASLLPAAKCCRSEKWKNVGQLATAGEVSDFVFCCFYSPASKASKCTGGLSASGW